MIKQRLMDDLKVAMKRGDRVRVDCVRMLRSRLLEREVALRPQKGAQYEIDDDEALSVIATYAKQRRESIESFRQAGREELASREEAELAIVEGYLPQQLDEAALREIVAEVVAETGATSARDTGKVMKAVMARVRGSADGKLVSRLVGELLAPAQS